MDYSFEAVTVGDIHLDKLTSILGEDAIPLQIAEVRKVFTYAVKNKVPNVLVLGDVAHKPRLSYEALIALESLLDEFDGKVKIYIILGNHDVEMQGIHSMQPIHERVKAGKYKSVYFFDRPKQRIIDTVPVNFLPFPATEPLDDKKAINVAHLERPGAMRDNGSLINKGGIEQTNDQFFVVGHLHTPHEVGNSWFSGTLFQTNFGESLPKSFMHLKANYNKKKNTLKYRVKRVPNDPAFKFFNLVVKELSDLKIIERNPLYLYKLFIHSDIELPKNLLRKYPNIINHVGYDTKGELKALMESSQEDIKYDIKEGLPELLKGKGYSKKKIKRALTLLDEVSL